MSITESDVKQATADVVQARKTWALLVHQVDDILRVLRSVCTETIFDSRSSVTPIVFLIGGMLHYVASYFELVPRVQLDDGMFVLQLLPSLISCYFDGAIESPLLRKLWREAKEVGGTPYCHQLKSCGGLVFPNPLPVYAQYEIVAADAQHAHVRLLLSLMSLVEMRAPMPLRQQVAKRIDAIQSSWFIAATERMLIDSLDSVEDGVVDAQCDASFSVYVQYAACAIVVLYHRLAMLSRHPLVTSPIENRPISSTTSAATAIATGIHGVVPDSKSLGIAISGITWGAVRYIPSPERIFQFALRLVGAVDVRCEIYSAYLLESVIFSSSYVDAVTRMCMTSPVAMREAMGREGEATYASVHTAIESRWS